MFIAHRDNFIPAALQGEMFFSSLELVAFMPWFVCDVPKYEGDCEEALFRATYLIGDIDKLYEFADKNKIEKTYLVSPGYMNDQDSWSLLRLKSIAQATHTIEEIKHKIYRFEIEDGRFIDVDLSGIENFSNDLEFKTVLMFD